MLLRSSRLGSVAQNGPALTEACSVCFEPAWELQQSEVGFMKLNCAAVTARISVSACSREPLLDIKDHDHRQQYSLPHNCLTPTHPSKRGMSWSSCSSSSRSSSSRSSSSSSSYSDRRGSRSTRHRGYHQDPDISVIITDDRHPTHHHDGDGSGRNSSRHHGHRTKSSTSRSHRSHAQDLGSVRFNFSLEPVFRGWDLGDKRNHRDSYSRHTDREYDSGRKTRSYREPQSSRREAPGTYQGRDLAGMPMDVKHIPFLLDHCDHLARKHELPWYRERNPYGYRDAMAAYAASQAADNASCVRDSATFASSEDAAISFRRHLEQMDRYHSRANERPQGYAETILSTPDEGRSDKQVRDMVTYKPRKKDKETSNGHTDSSRHGHRRHPRHRSRSSSASSECSARMKTSLLSKAISGLKSAFGRKKCPAQQELDHHHRHSEYW